ncbi:hypothetical protein L596_015223 [Steinernema carpocapsae]|uniref:Uncharacterized protein n=1 Tax=Steinernema carpocapsae TaxID=34508 RepID=A0A4U5NFA2_STECR|nr:hypothetical protein L596_015223 [Steinernema carpocapsae]
MPNAKQLIISSLNLLGGSNVRGHAVLSLHCSLAKLNRSSGEDSSDGMGASARLRRRFGALFCVAKCFVDAICENYGERAEDEWRTRTQRAKANNNSRARKRTGSNPRSRRRRKRKKIRISVYKSAANRGRARLILSKSRESIGRESHMQKIAKIDVDVFLVCSVVARTTSSRRV